MKVVKILPMKKNIIISLFTILLLVSAVVFAACTTATPTTKESTLPPSSTTQNRLGLHSRVESIPANAVKILPETDQYPPVLHSKMYKTPIPVSGMVNTAGAEDSPFIIPEGNTLYLFFTPDVSVPVEKQLLDGVTGIYIAVKDSNGTWGEPERVVLNDDISLDGAEFIQGNIMWFCSARAGYQGINWFTAQMIDSKWQNWEYAGGQFPASYEVGELHFTANGQELYYHSSRVGGKGGSDIWVTRLKDGKWQEPQNVTVINTAGDEGWPCLTPDGNELWFNRTYLGTPAIFRSVKINGEWAEPELIISQFAGEPSLDYEGNIYFVHHYYRDGVMLEADIYVAEKY
jgi:hypothetical protein